jgi:hypothetical protein
MDLKGLGQFGPALPVVSGAPAPKGIDLYAQLLNALAADELHEKSAGLLTTDLRTASVSLKSAYYEAVSRLPPSLASKDWGFSISKGALVLTVNQDQLSPQDLEVLRIAFNISHVETAAKQVAAAIISIVQMRKAGGDPGSLAWVRFDVDETNFGERLDLRSYVTATAPGSSYHPSPTNPATHAPVPPVLGQMDLRELLTTRPRFLRADGSVSPEAVNELEEIPRQEPEVSTLHGQCSCGQVRFIVHDEFEYAFYCHCSRCRARTGSVFAAIAGISIEKLEVIAGHEHLLLEGECSDGYGARCSQCHAFLFAAVRGRKYLHVSLGVVRDIPSRTPDHHIYVGSKAPWYQITDTLPQYDELP